MQILPDSRSTTAKCDPVRLRLYLMDFEITNAPLFQQYLSDQELETCINWALDDFNESIPILEYKFTLLDFPLPKLLLRGAALEAMNLTLMKEMRGEMQYQDGGVSNAIYYKSQQFMGIRSTISQEYEQSKMKTKRQMNLENCYGGIN